MTVNRLIATKDGDSSWASAEDSEEVIKFLKQHGYHVIPPRINAVLLQFSSSQETEKFVNHLQNNNVVVSRGNGASNIGLNDTFVRIAIGTEEQMNTVKQILQSYKT